MKFEYENGDGTEWDVSTDEGHELHFALEQFLVDGYDGCISFDLQKTSDIDSEVEHENSDRSCIGYIYMKVKKGDKSDCELLLKQYIDFERESGFLKNLFDCFELEEIA
jgi:hypothetical protein